MRFASSRHFSCALMCLAVRVASGGTVFAESVQARATIRLKAYNEARVPDQTLERAQQAVVVIFKTSGVNAEWVNDNAPQFRVAIGERGSVCFAGQTEMS